MTDLQNPQDLTDEQLEDVLVELEVSIGGKPVGTMRLELWPKAAPATVRNFTRYVSEGFYNGKIFHRVIPGFMIQGGCPQGSGRVPPSSSVERALWRFEMSCIVLRDWWRCPLARWPDER